MGLQTLDVGVDVPCNFYNKMKSNEENVQRAVLKTKKELRVSLVIRFKSKIGILFLDFEHGLWNFPVSAWVCEITHIAFERKPGANLMPGMKCVKVIIAKIRSGADPLDYATLWGIGSTYFLWNDWQGNKLERDRWSASRQQNNAVASVTPWTYRASPGLYLPSHQLFNDGLSVCRHILDPQVCLHLSLWVIRTEEL